MRGGNHRLCNIDCTIQRGWGAIKEVWNVKNSIDQCTVPEYTNEYLVKAKLYIAISIYREKLRDNPTVWLHRYTSISII